MKSPILGALLLVPFLAVVAQEQESCPQLCDATNPCIQATLTGCDLTCDNAGITTTLATCLAAEFENSNVNCVNGACRTAVFQGGSTATCDANSCQDSTFADVAATCSSTNSCENSVFNRTTVSCSGDSCDRSEFYASSATCPSFDSCDSSVFYYSCCDGSGCPSSALSCSDVVGFCSNQFLGRTYKDWGHPLCVSITVSTTNVRNDVRICRSGDCANTQFDNVSIYCDNKDNGSTTRVCQSSSFTNSLVYCDSGSCQGAKFADAGVTCAPLRADDSCNNSIFNRTTATCSGDSCDNSDFYASAITCTSFDSCDSSSMYYSCCDGSGCPNSVLSCNDVVAFCSNQFLGRTYKDWGNPLCESISTTTASLREEVLICRSGDCANTQFSAASVYCDNKDNGAATRVCQSATFSNCLVFCEAGACQSSSFTDTTATLDSNSSGDDSTFTRSSVTCSGDSCDRALFISSGVFCPSFDSCDNASFDECSCCDGSGCPSSVASCTSDVATFCSRTLAGQQCRQLGNPVCGEVGPPPTLTNRPTSSPIFVPPPSAFPTQRPVAIPTPLPVTPTRRPTNNPTFSPNSPPTDVPTAFPQQPVVSPTTSPSRDTSDITIEYSIDVDSPITIPADNSTASVRVTSNPRNGNANVNEDNSLSYTPNPGFVGVDVFSAQYCDVTNSCQVKNFVLTVVANPSESKSSGGSSGLYGLAALVLIPIAVAAFFLWKRNRTQRKETNEATLTQRPSEAGPSRASRPGYASASHNESGTSPPSSANMPSRPMDVRLTNKDQAGTHIMEQQGQQAVVEGAATSSGPTLSLDSHEDSIGDQTNKRAGVNSYTPTAKDQCRTVVRPHGEVPIVSAVEVEPDTPKRKALEP